MNYECKLKELLGFGLEHRLGHRHGLVLGPGLGLGLIPALGLSVGLRDLHFKFGQVEVEKLK